MAAQNTTRVSYEEAGDIFDHVCRTYGSNPANHAVMIAAYEEALAAVGWTSDELADEAGKRVAARVAQRKASK